MVAMGQREAKAGRGDPRCEAQEEIIQNVYFGSILVAFHPGTRTCCQTAEDSNPTTGEQEELYSAAPTSLHALALSLTKQQHVAGLICQTFKCPLYPEQRFQALRNKAGGSWFP